MKELEFESNSLPFGFGCVISNWNLNVITQPPMDVFRSGCSGFGSLGSG